MSENTQPKPLTRNALVISVAFTVIVASIFGAYLTLTLGNNGQQLAITSSSISTCLQEVPANSTISGGPANTTFVGTNVTMTNGTQRLYPLGSCPQPATPTLYNVALSIERNTSFVALENGSQYEVDPVDSLGTHESGNFGTFHDYSVVLFNDYSNQTYFPCNPSFISKTDLGQIQVELDTLPNGSLDLSHPVFSVVPKDELNVWNCPEETITVSAAILYAGSASAANFRGTATFSLSINNPGGPTNLTSVSLTLAGANNRSSSSNATVFQCMSSTQCTIISLPQILAGSITNFTSPDTIFRFSTTILPGKAYIYSISFANGESDSGSLVAQ